MLTLKHLTTKCFFVTIKKTQRGNDDEKAVKGNYNETVGKEN
jgi:hypothetical protein